MLPTPCSRLQKVIALHQNRLWYLWPCIQWQVCSFSLLWTRKRTWTDSLNPNQYDYSYYVQKGRPRNKFFKSVTKLPISFMGYLFVDDANIVQGSDDVNTSGKALIPNFQEFIQWWNGGIRASGGVVCPKKTKWFLIDFKLNGKDYEYWSIEDIPGDILITSGRIYNKDHTERTIISKWISQHPAYPLK